MGVRRLQAAGREVVIQEDTYDPDTMLSTSYILFYLTLQQARKLRLKCHMAGWSAQGCALSPCEVKGGAEGGERRMPQD